MPEAIREGIAGKPHFTLIETIPGGALPDGLAIGTDRAFLDRLAQAGEGFVNTGNLGTASLEITRTKPTPEGELSIEAVQDYFKKNPLIDPLTKQEIQLPDIARPKKACVETIFAGLGHNKEALAAVYGLAKVGIDVSMLAVDGLVNPEVLWLHKAAIGLHGSVLQGGEPLEDYLRRMVRERDRIGERMLARVGSTLARLVLNAVPEQNGGISIGWAQSAIETAQRSEVLSSFLLTTFLDFEARLTEHPLGRMAALIEQCGNYGFYVAAHAQAVRALRYLHGGNRILNISSIHVPDPGFIKLDAWAGNERVRAAGLLMPLVGRGAVHTVATQDVRQAVERLYRTGKPVAETGTITDPISPNEFLAKWREPVRRILIPGNGNLSNFPVIMQILNEISAADPSLLEGMEFDLFIGFQPDDVWEQIRSALETMRPETAGRFHVYRSGNTIEAALTALALIRRAHVEIGRPAGENVLMNGASGCISFAVNSPSPNEPLNNRWAEEARIARVSRWPRGEYEMVMGCPPPDGLEFDNIVKYLRWLITVGEYHMSPAEAMAREAFVKTDPTANVYFTLIGLSQECESNLSAERAASIEGYMQGYRDQQIRRRSSAIGYSPDEYCWRPTLSGPEVSAEIAA